jgi:multimeric flavodoxin WrbA
MKVLAISFSPKKNGNTVTALEKALEGARAEGAKTELYSVAGKTIQPCDACSSCGKTGMCHIKDDMQEVYQKLIEADGIIFGTPVYFWGMTAQAKTAMDRTIALTGPDRNLDNKPAGLVVMAGSLGIADTMKDFYYYIVQRHMLPANQVSAYPANPEELKKWEQCMKAAYDLGRQIVALIKLDFKYPAEFFRGPGAFGTYMK